MVNPLLAIAIGVLYATGIYMMLRRSLVKLIIGVALLGNAANLFIFTTGGLRKGVPPLIAEGAKTTQGFTADPVPQALILTAIVIGFAVLAFFLVLVGRTYHAVGTDDLDKMKTTDR